MTIIIIIVAVAINNSKGRAFYTIAIISHLDISLKMTLLISACCYDMVVQCFRFLSFSIPFHFAWIGQNTATGIILLVLIPWNFPFRLLLIVSTLFFSAIFFSLLRLLAQQGSMHPIALSIITLKLGNHNINKTTRVYVYRSRNGRMQFPVL